MTHDEIAEVAFHTIRTAHEQGITDPLRLAHAIAVALKLAEREPANVKRGIAEAIGDDDDPGLTGEALDAWNAATARAVNIARNWGDR